MGADVLAEHSSPGTRSAGFLRAARGASGGSSAVGPQRWALPSVQRAERSGKECVCAEVRAESTMALAGESRGLVGFKGEAGQSGLRLPALDMPTSWSGGLIRRSWWTGGLETSGGRGNGHQNSKSPDLEKADLFSEIPFIPSGRARGFGIPACYLSALGRLQSVK